MASGASDRTALERLVRYLLRPLISAKDGVVMINDAKVTQADIETTTA